MTVAPFRRPAMVDIPWGERERWWTRTTRRLAERRRWGEVDSLAELGELVAQFCEGRLLETPGHGGPRDRETVGIGAPLAHANRRGFVTTGSQPGYGPSEHGGEQRAAVDGWATPATVERLRGLVAGTRLQMQVVTERPRRSNYDNVVNVSRQHTLDGGVREHTHFGFTPGRREPFIDLGRSDLTEGACYVTIYDPQWGAESLLWDRLGQRDWDNPAPPDPETLMPDQSDVKVHHSKGCGLCGRTDPHTHTLSDWRAHIGGDVGGGYEPPPAAQPFEPSKYEAEAQRQADHRRRHNEWLDAENEKSAAHRREQDEETARRARLAADLARHDAAVEARKRPDLADLRRGRWYDEKPITSTNTGSGGSGMSSIDEVRAGINASNEKANEGLGAVQQAHAALEEAQGLLMHATEGSGQADVSDSLGMLAQSIAAIEEARQMLPAAISASEGVANRL